MKRNEIISFEKELLGYKADTGSKFHICKTINGKYKRVELEVVKINEFEELFNGAGYVCAKRCSGLAKVTSIENVLVYY